MKRYILIFSLILAGIHAFSQTDSIASPKQKSEKPVKHIKVWHISEQLAVADTIPMDTATINFPDQNPVETFSIANSYGGNLGLPLQSKLYFNRPQGSDFLFDNAYKPYTLDISSASFYDTTFPFTNLTYLTGGSAYRKEEQVKFLFTASPSGKANFGTTLDYIHAVGEYNNQAAKRFSGGIFGRYNGKHYSANGLVAVNNHFNYENGGLSDLSYLTNPDLNVKPKDIPVAITGYSVFRKNQFYYNHSYSIGFNRDVKVSADSVRSEYVPVTRFGHTIKLEEMKKRYYEPTMERKFYEFSDTTRKIANDTAAVRTLTNLVSISLEEEFNKWMKFGLTGYVENEIQQFTYQPDSTLYRATKSNTRVGGVLSKNRGTNFRYSLLGDIYLIGYKLGEFRLEGKAIGNFKLFNEQISLSANAFIRNEEPAYYLQHYYSTHFRWDNQFSKMYKTHVSGSFSLPKFYTQLNVGVENITDYIYFNEKALPEQYQGNIQVLSADLKQDFHFGKFVLENNAVYQVSSVPDVLPLPGLTLFHNFYYYSKWFKDLYPQLGASVRYHSNYYAPAYMPATGQFYTQKEVLIGNYPILNVYANFHLKQARFFIEYNHLNKYFMSGAHFYMPNYPINPPVMKLGLSWNFYN